MKTAKHRAFASITVAMCLSGCDSVRMAPQIIDADGQTYLACTGLVWAKDTSGLFSGDTVFKVSFTDSGNKSHTIWGIRKLSISEPPAEEVAPFPANVPDPSVTLDVDGKAFVNGRTYTWPDGSKAELVGGKWKPVKIAQECK